MVSPDRWVSLMIASSKLNYSRRKTSFGGIAMDAPHAITSKNLAGVALLVRMLLVKSFFYYLKIASITLLMVARIYFILKSSTKSSK